MRLTLFLCSLAAVEASNSLDLPTGAPIEQPHVSRATHPDVLNIRLLQNEVVEEEFSSGSDDAPACDTGCIVGSIIGGIAGLLLLLAVAYYCCLKRGITFQPSYPNVEMGSIRSQQPIRTRANEANVKLARKGPPTKH